MSFKKRKKKSLSFKVFLCLWFSTFFLLYIVSLLEKGGYIANLDSGLSTVVILTLMMIFFFLWIISIFNVDYLGFIVSIVKKLPLVAKKVLLVIVLIGVMFIGGKVYAYADSQSQIMQAQDLKEKGEFSSAKEKLSKAKESRLSRGQQELVNQIQKEVDQEVTSSDIYNQAMDKFNSGSWEEARELFGKVSFGTSKYHGAYAKISECTQKIVEPLRVEAIELAKKYSVWWGESWAQRDKRSREEILASYNEQQLRDFIDKWENYSGGGRSTTIPKVVATPSPIATWTPPPPIEIATPVPIPSIGDNNYEPPQCDNSRQFRAVLDENENYRYLVDYNKSIYEQMLRTAYTKYQNCQLKGSPNVFQSSCGTSYDYSKKKAKEEYDDVMQEVETKHKNNLAIIDNTCY